MGRLQAFAVCLLCAAALAAAGGRSVTGPIRAFVIPHSHDDIAWIQTFDSVGTGARAATLNLRLACTVL
jgi:hypothetical protein